MMADALKGDVDVSVGDDVYTFRFGGSAMMALERSFPGQSFLQILLELKDKDRIDATPITHVAKLAHAALRYHHPALSLDDAAEVAIFPEVQRALGEAIKLALPLLRGGDGDDEVDPPKSRARSPRRSGTGTKP